MRFLLFLLLTNVSQSFGNSDIEESKIVLIAKIDRNIAEKQELKKCKLAAQEWKTFIACNRNAPQITGNPPTDDPKHFQNEKVKSVTEIDNTINELSEQRSCMTGAADWNSIQQCSVSLLKKALERTSSLGASGFEESKKTSIAKVDQRILEKQELKKCKLAALEWKTFFNCNKNSPQMTANPPMDDPKRFQKVKDESVAEIDNTMNDLLEQKTCMAGAAEWKSIQQCYEIAMTKAENRSKAIAEKMNKQH